MLTSKQLHTHLKIQKPTGTVTLCNLFPFFFVYRTMSAAQPLNGKPADVVISKLHYFPIITAIIGVLGILTTYIVAVCLGDVEPWLPYIRWVFFFPPIQIYSIYNFVWLHES